MRYEKTHFQLYTLLCSLFNHAHIHICVCVYVCLSCDQLFVTPWTVAHQAPLSMGFSRQECWSGLPFLLPRDLPDPRIEIVSPVLADTFFTTVPPGKPNSLLREMETFSALPTLIAVLLVPAPQR